MKKILMLIAMVAMFGVNAFANFTTTCQVYGGNGTRATLIQRGDDCSNSGHITIGVQVTNVPKDSFNEQKVRVVVNVYQQGPTTCTFVNRKTITVYIKPGETAGSEELFAGGYKAGEYYLFDIDQSQTCM